MGMDVYGRNPKNETGEYFRRNVWGWHPLWEYCQDAHPEIANKVEHGHSNSGDGLGSRDSVKLAKLMKEDIRSGFAEKYIKDRQEHLDALPLEDCTYCNTTGKRTWKAGEGPNDTSQVQIKTCNACHGEGKVKNWSSNYYLDLDDIKDFAEFLENSGGFNIH